MMKQMPDFSGAAVILAAISLGLGAGASLDDRNTCTTNPSTSNTPVSLAPFRTEDLRSDFNRASDRVRIIALLSPTCGGCQRGQRVVQAVFSKLPAEPRLRGFVVWLPMLARDDQTAASAQAAAFIDPRVVQRWDASRQSGELAAKTLKLKATAWDVYLLYAPGVKWTGAAPPKPTFWMHQLREENGADQKLCLNPTVFLNKVRELLHQS